MYFYRPWSEPQAPPPPPAQQQPPPPPAQTTTAGVICLNNQHYPTPLPHTQQPPPLPYPTNPSLPHTPCTPIPIRWTPGENKSNPYAPHGGYASADYPCAGEGTSAVDGVVGYGGEESRAGVVTDGVPQEGSYTVGCYIAAPPNCLFAACPLPHQSSFNPPVQSVPPHQISFNPPIQSVLPHQNSFNPPIQSAMPHQNASNPPIQSVPPHQNTVNPPPLKNTKRIVRQKVAKVLQTSHCGVCKLDCNSQDALKAHKQGKKHHKNLKKLQDSITPKPAGSTANTIEQLKEAKRKAASLAETEDELKAKKIKVLEAGASADEVRVCSICSVVMNSQKVYECHLTGQKHQAMVEKLRKAVVS